NKQYNAPVKIKINEIIHQRIQHFQDFYENKNINISEKHIGTTTILMDSALAEVLIDNLIKNAILHNFQNGRIYISTENNQLIISNTGEIPKESTSVYFDRFYSQKPSQSLGLGLSIIKKIIDYYNYSISYNYENALHKIVVDFNDKS
ncbi:MAG: sensor histidine kinase, partial [Flavisolibacter sp.]